MKFSLLLLVCGSVLALQNNKVIEEDCKACTFERSKMFLKILHSPMANAEYVCRSSALLVSKFGIVADRSCSPEECTNITTRPISRTFNRYELFCQDDSTHGGTHLHVLTIVKDYVEIVLMGVMLALLLLKKSLIESCIKKKGRELLNLDHLDATGTELRPLGNVDTNNNCPVGSVPASIP